MKPPLWYCDRLAVVALVVLSTIAILRPVDRPQVSMAVHVVETTKVEPAPPDWTEPEDQPPAGFGTITGRLISDRPGESPDMVVDPNSRGVRFCYAYLVKPRGRNLVAEEDLRAEFVNIDLRNGRFLPRAAAALAGQMIHFRSHIGSPLTIHWNGFYNGAGQVALPPRGEVADRFITDPVPIPLRCDEDPTMSGWLMVFDHPFFAVTAADGRFTIPRVPAGPQRLVVRHERAGYVTSGGSRGMTVGVRPDEVTDVGEIVLRRSRAAR